MMKRYELHDIAAVHTDIDLQIPPSFGRGSLHTDCSLRIERADYPALASRLDDAVGEWKRSGVFKYATTDDALFIRYKTPVGAPTLQLAALAGEPTIRYTDAFREHGDLTALARAVYRLHLLWRGWPLVHAGAVARDGRATLVTAPPDHGKTSTVLSLLDADTRFLGDDHVFLGDRGGVRAYPRPVHLSAFTLAGPLDRDDGVVARAKRALAASRFEMVAGALGIDMGERRLVPAEYRTDRATCENVVVLAGGRGGVERIAPRTAARHLVTATLDEFDPFGHYALLLAAHAFDLPVADAVGELQGVVGAALANVDCYRVRAGDVAEYPSAIRAEGIV